MIDVEALNCQELVELVTDFLEGALDERDLRAFERHLEHCDGCTEYLEQLRTTIRLTGSLTLDDLSTDAETTLLQAFRDWRRRDP
ncbi:MAG TPA: zf-HC2 domain-containing protein [Gaiellaceae bacterium]|jgi:anti-sigma factor RsiW|nr:zf-HC2 domain-containing protein [Gaiellaceae bacterium]